MNRRIGRRTKNVFLFLSCSYFFLVFFCPFELRFIKIEFSLFSVFGSARKFKKYGTPKFFDSKKIFLSFFFFRFFDSKNLIFAFFFRFFERGVWVAKCTDVAVCERLFFFKTLFQIFHISIYLF